MLNLQKNCNSKNSTKNLTHILFTQISDSSYFILFAFPPVSQSEPLEVSYIEQNPLLRDIPVCFSSEQEYSLT